MKSLKLGVIAFALAMFAVSCNDTTTTETKTGDSTTTTTVEPSSTDALVKDSNMAHSDTAVLVSDSAKAAHTAH